MSRTTRGRGARRHVGVTMPRDVKSWMVEAASAMSWSAGDWVLAAAAEHGPRLQEAVSGGQTVRRQQLADPTFTALYLTDDEREELDDLARACGVNRSMLVTCVTRLARGADVDEVATAALATVEEDATEDA
jgi:hypothetical protein